jgi:DNA-binding IclR family transcriptional regulator
LELQRSPYEISVVNKALDVLEALQHVDESTLQEIARVTGLPKSSCFRLLVTLESRGYVERGTEEKRYRLTLQLAEMSKRLLSKNPVRRLSLSYMRVLFEEIGETVNVAVLSGSDVLYVDTIESRHPFRVTESPGSRSPVYITALGKAMAAHLPAAELEQLLEQQSFKLLTPRTITDRAAFLESLQQVRRWGYALDDEEAEVGVRCVAAPVLGPGGYPLAALSISAPAARLSITELDPVITAVKIACRSISEQMGYRR